MNHRTNSLTPAGHVMAATAAVMHHGIEHRLSAPSHIEPHADHIALRLPIHTFRAWRDTIVVEAESSTVVEVDLGGPAMHHTAKGFLSGTGVRVVIEGHMLADRTQSAAVAESVTS